MTSYLSTGHQGQIDWRNFIEQECVLIERQRGRPVSAVVKQLLGAESNVLFYITATLHLRYFEVAPNRHELLISVLVDFKRIVPKLVVFINQCMQEERFVLSPELIDQARAYVQDLMVLLSVNSRPPWFTGN